MHNQDLVNWIVDFKTNDMPEGATFSSTGDYTQLDPIKMNSMQINDNGIKGH